MPARLDIVLVRRHPGLSRRKARDVIEKGQVTVAGVLAREPGQLVPEDAEVAWDANRRALPRARLRLPVLLEDEHLLVVDKPAGLLSVPTEPGADEDTALGRVREYVARLHPRRPYVGLVHRLDRDTSGALAFALSPAARSGLIALFRQHRIVRRYAALVEGVPRQDAGTVDAPLHEAYVQGRRRVARPGEEEARPAVTRWRVRERLAGAALVDVELDTGRQHQIRVHLAHAGLPVLGDPVYRRRAGPPPLAVPRQMLHAAVLGFRHPLRGEDVLVESPLPPDFLSALEHLRSRRPR